MRDWGMPAAFAILGAALVGWNLALGARVSAQSSAGRAFRALTGLCAFLLVPSFVIGLLTPTAPGARVLEQLAWLWPVVVTGVAVQALWALLGGRASVAVAFPIALFDLMVAWVAVARWLEGHGAMLGAWVLAPGMAVSSIGATVLGEGAFLWSAAALVPVLVPVAPARWRLSGAWRALLAAGCIVALVLLGSEVPSAYGALTSGQALGAGTMPERARTDFAVGLRLFGTLSGAPAASVVRHDITLADSLGVTALHLELGAEGATAGALDSMARSIAARRDSLVLVVTLDMDRGVNQPASDDDAWMRERIAFIERVMTRLRPDVLLPAEGVAPFAGAGAVPWWQSYYERVARSARRIDGNIIIALATDAGSPADSALCDWVMQGGSPVGAIALAVRAHSDTPARFEGAQAALARWVSMARVVPAVWLIGVPTSPAVAGEVAQQRLVRHALLWGASRTWVRGVIAGDASDALASTGLRTPGGRARRALTEIGLALRSLRDAPMVVPIAVDTSVVDSLRPALGSLPTSQP